MKKILGIGNALVDILIELKNDDILNTYNLPKGSMQLVDDSTADKILTATKTLTPAESCGGSAANTIHGLACLGAETAYIGKVGVDKYGSFFSDDMQKKGVETKIINGQAMTGRAVTLITPDSERTFATYLGSAVELSASDLKEELFDGYDYFHAEGYLVFNRELIEAAVKMAKAKGLKVSIDMASFNVVEDNLDFLKDLVKNYVDIVFANEEEAKAFTGMEPEDALHEIAKYCDIAIVKIGKQGSLVKKGNDVYKIAPVKANSKDTTGAGDLYAAGFLYGLVKNLSLDKCGDIGSILAGRVIEVIGAKMTDKTWSAIEKEIAIISSN